MNFAKLQIIKNYLEIKSLKKILANRQIVVVASAQQFCKFDGIFFIIDLKEARGVWIVFWLQKL